MNKNRFFLPAWCLSLTLHGAVVGLALVFLAQVDPILPEDMFRWDVALVEATKLESMPEQVQSVANSERSTEKDMPQPRAKRATEKSEAARPLERLQPAIETTTPIERRTELLQARDEQAEPRQVEAAEPKTEPVLESKEPELAPVAATPEPVETQSVRQEPAAIAASASPPDVPISHAASASVSSPDSTVNEIPASNHDAKADNRWLAESLWRRVAELKRYPHSARMNGQEGKVILKAVIRSDGQLADVFVQKSSGHSVLDAAAMEAVKLACPLQMKHAIGKPQIVVSLPIVYSLAN